MNMRALHFASLLGCVLASSFGLDGRRQSGMSANASTTTHPSVTLSNGTVVGLSANGTDSFRGIPYAQPPTGNLRLRRPAPLLSGFHNATFTATGVATACPQPTIANFSIRADMVQGEDCLTIDILRPAGCNRGSKLPVLFWIYGGGFQAGSTQEYDGTALVNAAQELDHPIIFVSVNYRVNGFGFLAGKEVQEGGVSNLGLRDQRLAMQWIQENIEHFGGDPARVTLFGESAGAQSAFTHTIIENGNNTHNGRPLFRAAIMNSGTTLPADEIDAPQAQDVYNQLVSATNCTSSNDTLQCLRNVTFQTYWDAVNTLPIFFSYSSIALPWLPRPDRTDGFYPVYPEDALRSGNYTRVPIITGDQEDEGTLFAQIQYNVTNTDLLENYTQLIFPGVSSSHIRELVSAYPDDQAAGSPFGTGDSNRLWPQYKRLAALLGDTMFTLRRRSYLYYASTTQSTWSYLDSHRFLESPLGTYHTSDIEAIFNYTPIVPTMRSIIPGHTYKSYYISFVYYLDPNVISTQAPLTYWPQYTTSHPVLLNIRDTGNTLVLDEFRDNSTLAQDLSILRF